MSQITNKTALITGGASGIGKLMGRSLLEKGLKTLVIWDINDKMLNIIWQCYREPSGYREHSANIVALQTCQI